MVKIFIDPGHGGSDPGAAANGLQEKDLALTIAQHVNTMLQDFSDVEVNMSRDRDRFVGLSERAQMANEWEADYFLSIHVNAGGGRGFESHVHSLRPERTVELQQIIHQEMIDKLEVFDRGQKSANFAVLRDDAFLRLIARANVQGLAAAFDLQKNNDSPSNTELYRVIINGTQVGAYEVPENILGEVERNLGQVNEIIIRKV